MTITGKQYTSLTEAYNNHNASYFTEALKAQTGIDVELFPVTLYAVTHKGENIGIYETTPLETLLKNLDIEVEN